MVRREWPVLSSSRHGVAVLLAAATAALVSVACEPVAAGSVGPADWSAFLDGPAHASDNHASDNRAQVAITPGNAAALVQKWHFVGDKPTMPGQPGPSFSASPTVADGAVFIGSRNGWFSPTARTPGTSARPTATCTRCGSPTSPRACSLVAGCSR